MSEATTARAIDRAALLRVVQRQAAAPEPPWLHAEVARRMAERLQIMKLVPTVVIDWWSRSGASRQALRSAYPRAQRVQVEPDAVFRQPRNVPWWSVGRRGAGEAVAESAVPDAQAQLLWANMMLHAVADPGALLSQWRRALSREGFVMFSTLGPDTLKTLREVYRDAGWGAAHAPFVDMHDVGDMLVRAGFADPVMDQEMLRLTWATPAALLSELRGLGANAAAYALGELPEPVVVPQRGEAMGSRYHARVALIYAIETGLTAPGVAGRRQPAVIIDAATSTTHRPRTAGVGVRIVTSRSFLAAVPPLRCARR